MYVILNFQKFLKILYVCVCLKEFLDVYYVIFHFLFLHMYFVYGIDSK